MLPKESSLENRAALILFTKVPLPGLVKTRMINKEGGSPTASEISELYRCLLQDTLRSANQFCRESKSSFIVSFTPASVEDEIRNLVGEFSGDAVYVSQGGTTVTERVRRVFEFAFDNGCTSAFLIPGDHPDIDGEVLTEAFSRLKNSKGPAVVVGPTFDGGAFLLGFNRASFERVSFSVENTHYVCADISQKARAAGIQCSFLENKNDIDDWDDARRFLSSNENKNSRLHGILQKLTPKNDGGVGPRFSIVIPTLNEERNIGTLVDSIEAQTLKEYEIIVVDGSSTDATLAQVWGKADKIAFVGKPSRKGQENVGALGAKGEILLFLHADMKIPPTLLSKISSAVSSNDSVLGGSSRAMFDGKGLRSSFLSAARHCGDRLLGIHGISSAFFVRRRVFLAAGGFREDVMEEAVDLQSRTRSLGKFVTLGETVKSSSRRFALGRTFVPTVAIWVMTVFLTVLRLHFTSLEKRFWKAVR